MATNIEDNYSADYSQYYLDFAASVKESDFGTVTQSAYTRNDTIAALRDAANRLAAKRGITVTRARELLRTNATLRERWMGADLAAAWDARETTTSGTRSRTGANADGSAVREVVDALGLADGTFSGLIDRAIRDGWTAEQFRSAVYQSPAFDKMFPGIKRADGSLRMDPAKYRALADSYMVTAKEFGITMDSSRIGNLIEGAVSPQEFYQRTSVFEKVKANAGLKDAFNEQLTQFGLKPLDDQNWFRFLAGVGSKDYYDVYEAAQLRSSGLNIDAGTAKGVAQNIGETGSPLDIQGLVTEAKNSLADIGPELLRAGITDADLVQMAAGYDPKGLEPKLRTIIANRRGTGAFVVGNRVGGSGEGATVFTPEQSAAY